MATSEHSTFDEFLKGLWKENPVFVQLLGLCPALAVTNSAINGLAMGAATTFVLVMASLLVADELSDTRDELAEARQDAGSAAADRFDALAGRIEALAEILETTD